MATIKGEVISGDTGQPLDAAAIQIVNKDGMPLGPGVAAGSDGRFTLTSALLPGNYIAVSYQGLISVMISASMLNDTRYTQISLFANAMDPVIVTPRKGSLLWLLLGLAAVAGAKKVRDSRKKKRKRYV
jgi:hypothetical protein